MQQQRTRKTPHRGEEIEQARLIAWSHKPAVRALMPALKWLHHSANGGKRDAFTGAQMKALGVKPGFPDLILPVRRGFAGLAMEMKADDGRVSKEQDEWLQELDEQGWHCAVCRSADEARHQIMDYLGCTAAPELDA